MNAKCDAKFYIPLTYDSTLMSVAYSKNGKESGLDGQTVKAMQLKEIARK